MNTWCEVLNVDEFDLADVVGHREAIYYSMLFAAVLHAGRGLTLEEAAERLEAAGAGDQESLVKSMKRCRPDRPPLHKVNDSYEIDPHHHEAGLWAFRLDLRPPASKRDQPEAESEAPPTRPLGAPEDPLTLEDIDEAFRADQLSNFSAQALALAVLDAHDGPLPAEDVVGFISERATNFRLEVDQTSFHRKNSAIGVDEDGRWSIGEDAETALLSARRKIRKRIETDRRYGPRPDYAASTARADERRRREAEIAAARRRVVVYAYPADSPQALATLDVTSGELKTYLFNELERGIDKLLQYDFVAALGVRELAHALAFHPGKRVLAELRPPQKTAQITPSGKPVRLTDELIIRSCIGVERAFSNEPRLARALEQKDFEKAREILAANVKTVHALYRYERLHRGSRAIHRGWEVEFPAGWVGFPEPTIRTLMSRADEEQRELEIVYTGIPVNFEDPWAHSKRASILSIDRWNLILFVEKVGSIAVNDVVRARLVGEDEFL